MLFQSSIRKELTRTFGATLFVLLIIVITMMLIRTLNLANRGTVDPTQITLVLGFTVLAYLPTILTLSLFTSVVYTLARMYRDSEMAVWFSSGQSLLSFLRPLAAFAWPVIVAIAVLVLVSWPWANARSQKLVSAFQSRQDVDRIAPGQFQESGDGLRVFYVDDTRSASRGGASAPAKLFVFARQPKSEVVITAHNGSVRPGADGRFAVLQNGQSAEIHDDQTLTLSHFGEYAVRLDDKARPLDPLDPTNPGDWPRVSPRMVSTPALLGISEPRFRGELSWRIGSILAAVNLLLLALASSHFNPRSGRSSGLVVALLLFVAYYNLLNFGKNWIATGKIGTGALLLVLHGGIFALTCLWLLRRNSQWKLTDWLRSRRPAAPAGAAA